MHFFQKSPPCALIGACAVNRANTVAAFIRYCRSQIFCSSVVCPPVSPSVFFFPLLYASVRQMQQNVWLKRDI